VEIAKILKEPKLQFLRKEVKTIIFGIVGSAWMMEVESATIRTIRTCSRIRSLVTQLMAYAALQMHQLAIVPLTTVHKCAV